jgi:apolipoprotein N-acyltransferase
MALDIVQNRHSLLTLPFGLTWSLAVHNWYPSVFPSPLGHLLIVAVGFFYAGVIQLGVWLRHRTQGVVGLLALPITWAAVEFARATIPVMRDWWFVLLAKSQWRFPPALQILGLTGFPGLAFLIMLSNVALVSLLSRRSRVYGAGREAIVALMVVLTFIGWGAVSVPPFPPDTVAVAALTDLVYQDSSIAVVERDSDDARPSAKAMEMIFSVDAALTQQAISLMSPAMVVWPENEVFLTTDEVTVARLRALAADKEVYIVANGLSPAPNGGKWYNVAVLYSPDGDVIGGRAKINITDGEASHGIVPGPRAYPVFDTPYGRIGVGVCWDRHPVFIVRELARNGAQIVAMPANDDFDANPMFPPFHASDAVLRAVENHVAFIVSTTSGLSIIVDPYGRIVAEGKINQRGVIGAGIFTVSERTLYTRFGDWAGWLLVIGWMVLTGRNVVWSK